MSDERSKQGESLPEEIHRRGLWQAAVGYLAVGWALIEVVDVLTSRGVLPESVFYGALVVLLVGFPVILATAYVQTPPLAADGATTREAGPAGRFARLFTWRNAILGGIGAFALLGVVTAGTTVLRVADVLPDDAVAIDRDRVAVFPFTVRGSSELDYLGEGIVDLVSAKLDGAASLTAADPRAVIAGATAGDVELADPVQADRLAARLGAGRFVVGELIESGGTVRLTATLRPTGQPGDAGQTATVEGTAAEIFGALDRLVAELLAEVLEAEGDRLQSLATVTTGSLEAAKEYLRGERLLRAAKYREAGAAYDRAIALDSTFALAHYRKSIAADWTDAFDIRSSAENAMEYSGKLSSRERNLLRALSLRRSGQIAEAEQVFRALLHENPNDVEALVQLGEVLFHDVGRQGRSMRESLAPFRRAADLEPNNLIAQLHLARLYAAMDSTARLEETAAVVTRTGDEGERTVEVVALAAFFSGDSARQREVVERLTGSAWYYWWYAGYAIGSFAREIDAAEGLIERRDTDSHLLQLLEITFDVIRGRYEAVDAAFDAPSRRGDPLWLLYEAFLRTSGAMPPNPERARDLAARLAPLSGEELHRATFVPPYEDITPRFEEYQRDFFRALLLVQAGEPDAARSLLRSMRSADDFEGLGSVKGDAELAVEAALLVHAGDGRGALEKLRRAENRLPHAAIIRPMSELSGSRFLRGRLEQELGDAGTAERFLLAMDESWSPWDVHLRAEAYDRLGQIAQEAGRTNEAVAYYTRLLELWSGADPSLDDRREAIEARRDALLREQG